MEAHSPLSGLIAENSKFTRGRITEQFDAMWSSSLTDSSVKGKPDNQALDFSSRFNSIGDLFDVTTKPLIFDADNGGRLEHLSFTIRTLERLGVSAIMIEDKIGLKKNSLFKDQSGAQQDTIKDFCKKTGAKKALDVGANFGKYSRILANSCDFVLSTDNDVSAINNNYLHSIKRQLS